MATRSRATKRKLPWYLRPFKWLVWFILFSIVWVLVYTAVPTPVTFTMLDDSNGITKDWESLSNIDSIMVSAVLEWADGRFSSQEGICGEAIKATISITTRGGKRQGGK